MVHILKKSSMWWLYIVNILGHWLLRMVVPGLSRLCTARQKRPIIWEKETYYVGNRDLEYRQKRPKHLTFENEPPRYKSSIENTIENTFYLL